MFFFFGEYGANRVAEYWIGPVSNEMDRKERERESKNIAIVRSKHIQHTHTNSHSKLTWNRKHSQGMRRWSYCQCRKRLGIFQRENMFVHIIFTLWLCTGWKRERERERVVNMLHAKPWGMEWFKFRVDGHGGGRDCESRLSVKRTKCGTKCNLDEWVNGCGWCSGGGGASDGVR